MKRTIFSLMLLITTLFVFRANAQDDFTKGSDYHLIYLDPATKATIPPASIKKDFTVDDVSHFLYVWNSTYISLPTPGPNWNGQIGEYLNFQVGNVGWSGFGLACNPSGTATKDMSAVNGEYTLHLAMKSTHPATHCIMMEGGPGIQARVAVGATPFVDGAITTDVYTDFPRDGQWHLVEIPMTEFFNKGLRYPAPFKNNVFALLSGGVPGVSICLDAIFVYRKDVTSVVNNMSQDLDIMVTNKTVSVMGEGKQLIELFNLTGQKVRSSHESIMGIEDIQKGIYIVRCGNRAKKIQIN